MKRLIIALAIAAPFVFGAGGFLQTDPVDSGTSVEIIRPYLENGEYHWQYRAYVDATGESSPWTRYETDDANLDFTVETTQVIKVAVILAEPDGSQFQQFQGPLPYRDHFDLLAESTRDYWCEVSFGSRVTPSDPCTDGLIELQFDFYPQDGGPYSLTKTNEDYGDNFSGNNAQTYPVGKDGFGETFEATSKDKTAQFVWDSIKAADNDIPYNNYQAVIALHPGDSQQSGGGSDAMRTAFWRFERTPEGNSNEVARRWIAVSENELTGVWAHEMGHAIGHFVNEGVTLCDIYDTARGCGSIGSWGLMGGTGPKLGSPNGSNPSHLSSYSKEDLGWLGENFVGLGTHTVESVETQEEGDKIVKHKVSPSVGWYYQFEARTKSYTKWGTDIPKDALVIYRVTPNIRAINTDLGNVIIANRPIINRVKAIGIGDLPTFKERKNGRLFDLDNFTAGLDEFSTDVIIQEFSSTNYVILAMQPAALIYDQAYSVITPDEEPASVYGIKYADAQNGSGVPPDPDTWEGRKYALQGLWRDFIVSLFALWYSYAALLLMIGGGAFVVLRTLRKRGRDIPVWSVRIVKVLFVIVVIYTVLVMLLAGGIVPFELEQRVTDWVYGIDRGGIDTGGLGPIRGTDEVPSEDNVGPDLDLHAYDDQGNHVGMNYETGLYEINIPGAEASGELVYDEEWIAIPDGVNVTYEVASDDLTEFIEQNPDFASGLASTSEEYSIQAVTYDSTSQRYESAPVENITINPGETRVHTIGGTTEAPTVDEGVVVVELDVIGDSYLKKGHPNKNYGTETTTWIRGSGKRSTLVQFDQQIIDSVVGSSTLVSATLELETVDGTAGSWTSNGKLVGAYRLTHPWTELGATWNCGNDIDTSNSSTDCPSETWEMNQNQSFSWEAVASDSNLFTNDSSGTVSWDVASDVVAWLGGIENYGWIVRKDQDGAQGRIEFHSRETALGPRLILEFER